LRARARQLPGLTSNMPPPAASSMNFRSALATLSSLVDSDLRVPSPGCADGAERPPVADVPAPPDPDGVAELDVCAKAPPNEKATASAMAESFNVDCDCDCMVELL